MNRTFFPLFLLAVALHLISYVLPFLGNEIGYEFFKGGLYAFFNDHIPTNEMSIFFAFFLPLMALPLFCWACWREAVSQWWKVEFLFFTIFIFIPVLMTIFFAFTQSSASSNNFFGYLTWLNSFILLFTIYILKLRKGKIQDEDISRHLIDND